jgi:hypothetical protein
MNEHPDPLELELSALRPNDVSTGLRQRVEQSLAEVRPSKLRRVRWIALAGGLAAACLGLALLRWQGGQHRNEGKKAVPNPVPSESVDHAPTPLPQGYQENIDAPTFTWPVEESSPLRASMSIPSELLD